MENLLLDAPAVMPDKGTFLQSLHDNACLSVNPTTFTEFGRAWKAGEFDLLNPDSYEWELMWAEQYRRCLHGFSSGGKHMSGGLYFYSNFGTIDKEDKTEGGVGKILGLPDLRDVEWYLDAELEYCLHHKVNLCYVSGRRLGKSYIAGGRLLHAANFLDQRVLVAAGIEEKGQELMQKVEQHHTGLAGTEFYMPVLSGSFLETEVVFGYKEQRPDSNQFVSVKVGGQVSFRNFKVRGTAANGISAYLTYIEEGGMFDNLRTVMGHLKYVWMVGNRQYGICVLQGTGGDMDKGSVAYSEIFQDPEQYNFKVFNDESSPGKKTGLFIPGWMAYDECRDDKGNIDAEAAVASAEVTRAKLKKGRDLNGLLEEMQYRPMNWQESFLKSGSNIFPQQLIQEQIKRIASSELLSTVGIRGHLEWKGPEVVFSADPTLRETKYPVKAGQKNTGCLVIYEHPMKLDGHIPASLYVAGIDPYRFDEAKTSVSLGSIIVFKRMIDPMKYTYDIPVAEYTGRLDRTRDFHEICRRLLTYYNAQGLYESDVEGLKEYLITKHSLHLLAPTPPILKDILPATQVDRTHGVHASVKLKHYMWSLIADYLQDEWADGRYNVEKILSLNLLYELRDFDPDGNYDRVDAFGLALLQDQSDFAKKIAEVAVTHNENFAGAFFIRNGWKAPAQLSYPSNQHS